MTFKKKKNLVKIEQIEMINKTRPVVWDITPYEMSSRRHHLKSSDEAMAWALILMGFIWTLSSTQSEAD